MFGVPYKTMAVVAVIALVVGYILIKMAKVTDASGVVDASKKLTVL